MTITDHLDGSPNAREVSFGLDGKTWLIDLSAKNRAALEKALKPYIAKATEQRRGATQTKTSRSTSRSKMRPDLAAIRQWAKDNGHEVSDRGRIRVDIVNAYEAARKR